MKIDAQLLWQAVKNASLFCRDKTWNGGEAMLEVESGLLSVISSNDFVTVVSQVPVVLPPFAEVEKTHGFIGTKDLKEVEKGLRDRTGEIEFELASNTAKEPQWWKDLETLVMPALGRTPKNVGPWELNPEHLTLLSRLEPKGQYPLSFQAFAVGDDWLWGFKYGTVTYGMIVPLEREQLKMGEEVRKVALW